MIWKTTFVAMEDDGHISKEEINESRKQTVLISVCKPSEPPLPLGLSREEYMEIKLQWKNFCKKLLLILQDRSDSVMIVVEFGAFARDFIPLPNDERKFKRLQCCHPHFILIQFAREEDVCKFVLEIAGSYRMTNDISEKDVSALCRYFKFGKRSALPQCMPIESAEYQGWYAKLPQCMDKDSAEFKEWIAKVQVREGLKGIAKSNKRRAVAAQLIRDGLEGEVTAKELKENKNRVSSLKHNYNSWEIKSIEENKLLKHGDQEACEIELSTNDVCKFLKASSVSVSAKTVFRSMTAKIEDGTSVEYSVLLLGKKEMASGIRVKLLSSVMNGKSIKVNEADS